MGNFKFPSRQAVERLREQYPPGTRISLLKMDDPYSKLQPVARATVQGVDDAGGLMCKWDNGEGLSLDYYEDDYRKLTAKELAEEQAMAEKEDMTEVEQDGGEMEMGM